MELYKGLSEERRKNTKRFLAIASNILAIIIISILPILFTFNPQKFLENECEWKKNWMFKTFK